MRIGFIGLGIMGSRMAKNLIKAGYPLNVYNRTKLKAEKLEGAHLHIMESPAQVAAESDVIITMLSTPEVVQEVALGEDGLVALVLGFQSLPASINGGEVERNFRMLV